MITHSLTATTYAITKHKLHNLHGAMEKIDTRNWILCINTTETRWWGRLSKTGNTEWYASFYRSCFAPYRKSDFNYAFG